MKLAPDDALWLEEAAESNGLQWHDDYSGRCMYGDRCIAVSGDDISKLLRFVVDTAWSNADLTASLLEESSVRSDNFGLGTIWYWPDISVDDEQEEV